MARRKRALAPERRFRVGRFLKTCGRTTCRGAARYRASAPAASRSARMLDRIASFLAAVALGTGLASPPTPALAQDKTITVFAAAPAGAAVRARNAPRAAGESPGGGPAANPNSPMTKTGRAAPRVAGGGGPPRGFFYEPAARAGPNGKTSAFFPAASPPPIVYP